ncbi:MAG TPA: DUF2911 domain-containing protein [Flavobacteriales bacterium]|nr:DUF2911 domain-containing protein [Flavobacteriales bacterium]
MKKFLFSLVFALGGSAIAQDVTLPEESQYAETMQRIGITDIKVTYHSPRVNGRTIFGGLVPYDQVWRAGANFNTTISFTHEVFVQGTKVAAGTYGVHAIPGKSEWVFILSSNASSWGSFYYKKEEDVLRVNVKPVAHVFTEYLNYEFTDRSSTSATLSLVWENISVPVKIDVDVKNIVLANMKNELRSLAGYNWQGYFHAAQFCMQHNFNLEEALAWTRRAEGFKPGDFRTLKLRADILNLMGKTTEADAALKEGLKSANEFDLNMHGYALMNTGKINEAIEIFKQNVKKFPGSWNVYDSLGEALLAAGDKKGAKANYEIALKKAPEQRKPSIQKIIDGIAP